MDRFVLGFMFDDDCERVALIQKKHPTWQRGKLNGIGGRVEKMDVDVAGALVREFEEETGLKTCVDCWHHFADFTNMTTFIVTCFRMWSDDIWKLSSPTEECVDIFLIDDLDYTKCVHMLDVLIPVATNTSFNHMYITI